MSGTGCGKDIESKAEDRADLVKRLFAVAISIGFGAAVISADWVKEGRTPSVIEAKQIAIVAIAIFVTVLSWDGYLASIRTKKLYDWPRFAIDVILVFTYLFLFATSKHSNFWLPILSFIFFLYVVWDILTIHQFPDKYLPQTNGSTPDKAITYTYIYGACDRPNVDRGPISTLSWAIYIWFVALIFGFPSNDNVFLSCIFAFAGLIFYRWDKSHKAETNRGLPSFVRVGLIVVLSCCGALIRFWSSSLI
ncbi:hypothetical protein HMPREF9696_02404 [Afipia clevelandensis ATCC 49720]|uniref:Uncharacterized protein n=1 Tax=Afipia clevelandensis ATCC 49720 TaxID=883079 RepID=K8NXR8_9BRAD|nr:hypothetical protein HMPREF9696_02404 [Afipia clevelandensis ATCC 49720]